VRFDGFQFVPADGSPIPPKREERSLRDRAGGLWRGSARGLTVTRSGNTRHYTRREGLPADRITTIFEDREGVVWVGTDGGVARLIDGKVESFHSGDFLSQDAILSLFEDREGDLWIGTETNGVTILRDQRFTTYTSREGLFDQIRCVFQDGAGVIWVGTDGGGLRRFTAGGGRVETLTTADGLASNVILSLAQDAKGDLLVGTPDGLNRVHEKAFSVLTASDGLAEDFVRSLYCDPEGSVWAGTRRGLSRITPHGIETYTQANGLGSDLIGALVKGKDGELWIGTLGGLTSYSKGVFKNYTVEDGLSSNVITDLYMDRDGTLWIATQGGGLNMLNNGAISSFPPQLGVPETIFGLAEDTEANLWLATKTGIVRLSKRELQDRKQRSVEGLTVVSYGTSDGLRVSECSSGGHPAVWKARDGTIWFATAKGVAALRMRRSTLNHLPPPVVINSVSVDDRTFEPIQLRQIGPGVSRLSFEYAGLSFAAPQKVTFRYRLEGFDKDWLAAGTRRSAYYTNLPPGSYRFHVIARNNDGVWNEQGSALAFQIRPHYYQTLWFRMLTLLAVGFLAYLIYWARVRQVRARFDAVLQERNRIAREIHDTLAQGFVAVSVQLEIVSRLLATSAEGARTHLDQARAMVRDSLADARRSIWELRSQSSEHQDFAARIANAAKQITQSSSARVEVQVHGAYRPLAPKVEDEVFRIAQEAVVNAVRHSGAEHIGIELNFETKRVRMIVQDNGRGFVSQPEAVPNGHYGLAGMRERAHQIGAELNIESLPGEGTRVSLEIAAK
jgi:signal transduction histidine kinase/ligand-binding sensor domain-containing protein